MKFKRRSLVAGNWKMNGLLNTMEELSGFLVNKQEENKLSHFDMLICPPATLIYPMAELIKGSGILLGAQDCHSSQSGAYTGDISAEMLQDLGCKYVILGHSERRLGHSETDANVKSKAEVALSSNLIVVVCIGETEAQYKNGVTAEIITGQVLNSVPDGASSSNIVIAYEPVWAIGTGLTPSIDEVQNVHILIRKVLENKIGVEEATEVRILYGGSVKPNNASELLALADVDGALVGGASLSGEDFWSIAKSCPK